MYVAGHPYEENCGYSTSALPLEARAASGYKFDSWTGDVADRYSAITTINMNKNQSVTANFVLKTQGKGLAAAMDFINSKKDILVIDVGASSNYMNAHILCARNYPWASGSFTGGINSLSSYKNYEILVYDYNGNLSASAADYLSEQGFKSPVYYMTSGLDDWIAEGYETFTTAEDANICTSLAPIAFAGTDQTVNESQKVILDGSGSSSGVTYAWTQVEGQNVSLSSPTAQRPTFTSPVLSGGDGELIFHLTVTDGTGKKDTDSVTVNVNWDNAAPTANAGPDQTVNYGDLVNLDGTGSTDPENSITSYQWTLFQGNLMPTLLNSSTVTPSFTAPSTSGFVVFQLTVTDNGGLTDTDTVKITIQDGGVVDTNDPPIADAGSDQTVTAGQTVILDSSGSTDADGSIASRAWTQTGGTPAITLPNPAAIKPVFTAPDVGASTVLTFTLTVTDNEGATDTDTVTVTVNPPVENQVPTANAGADQSVKEGKIVTLDGTGSTDSDGTIASYTWTQTDSTGVKVALSNSSAAKPTFTAPDVDASTVLTFTLVVTDNKGAASSADTVRITITKSSGGGGGGGCFINSLAN